MASRGVAFGLVMTARIDRYSVSVCSSCFALFAPYMKVDSGSWEFAFVAATPNDLLRARKQPVQARSEATVSAIFEATVQVLLGVGYRKMTTTRVAERAGVSVGTLYQYFPNRRALIAAVIERYLEETASLVERDCRLLAGRSLDEMAAGLVEAIIKAKCRRIEVSR